MKKRHVHVDVDITIRNGRKNGDHDFYHYSNEGEEDLSKAIKQLQALKKELDK